MANRVEINEGVENAIGLNVTGASVTVRFRGGLQAPVYDRQNGGALLSQPLSTVNGKIGGDSPAGAWVTEGDYDLDVTFGSDVLTFSWNASHVPQFVATLPAGVGTSAPEDGEHAIELYDAANGGAWLRRFRATAGSWDMVGGPPPANNSLPAGPRARQEFYLTGGNPTIQHMRYNGSSWDYVGTPPMVPVPGSPLMIKDAGQPGQLRMGHQLLATDFTSLLALPSTPPGIFNLSSTANLGSGGTLINKGAVTFTTGVEGIAASAARFVGNTAQALYIADTGGADPFRIKTGTWGGLVNSSKQATGQAIISKWSGAGQRAWSCGVSATGFAYGFLSSDGSSVVGLDGVTNIADGRWHSVYVVYDGINAGLYVDGTLEDTDTTLVGTLFSASAPVNIGSEGADGSTAASRQSFARIDECFVTPDILSLRQIQLLSAAKLAHGYSSLPRFAAIGVERSKRGATLVPADFPSQPIRHHGFTAGALTSDGTGGVSLVANVGGGAITRVAGADGSAGNGYMLIGAHNGFSATDTGLPSGTNSRTYGVWFWTSIQTAATIMAWGTAAGNVARLSITGSNTGLIAAVNGADSTTTFFVADGAPHWAVVTEENTPVDGIKRKLYIDGALVGQSSVLNTITLAGANAFRVGANADGTSPFVGGVDEPFVFNGILTQEQIAVLYQKSSQTLGQVTAVPDPYVYGFDATFMYVNFTAFPSNSQIDLSVGA